MSRAIRNYIEGVNFLDGREERECASNTMCRVGYKDAIDIVHFSTRIVTHYRGGVVRLYPAMQNNATLWRMNIFTPFSWDIIPCEDDHTIWEVFTDLDSARVTKGMMIRGDGDLQHVKKLHYDRSRFSHFIRR